MRVGGVGEGCDTPPAPSREGKVCGEGCGVWGKFIFLIACLPGFSLLAPHFLLLAPYFMGEVPLVRRPLAFGSKIFFGSFETLINFTPLSKISPIRS
jgi:hypothetical protein